MENTLNIFYSQFGVAIKKIWEYPVFNTVRAYSFLYKRFHFRVLSSLTLSVFSGFFQMAGILLLAPILQVLGGKVVPKELGIAGQIFNDLVAKLGPYTASGWWILGFVVFGVIAIAFKSVADYCNVYLRKEYAGELRRLLTDALFNLRWENYIQIKMGYISKVLLNDGYVFAQGAEMLLRSTGAAIISSIFLCCALYLMPWASLFILIFVLAIYAIFRLLGLYGIVASKELVSLSKKASEESIEIFNNLKYIFATGEDTNAKNRMSERFEESRIRYLSLVRNNLKRTALLEATVIIFIGLGLAYCLLVQSDRIGVQIVFLVLVYRSTPYLMASQRNYLTAKEYRQFADSWLALYEEMTPNQVVRRGGREATYEKSLEVKNVSYSYTNDKTHLKEVSFELPLGKCLVVLGESGSGKSTLLDLITGILAPVRGEVLVDGHSLANLKLSSWRRFISFVPQSPPIFSGTILENIAFGDPTPDLEKARLCAEKAAIFTFIENSPQGWQTPTGEGGKMLSGGQAQRIAIARALYREPKLLILDEVTSSLDQQNESAIAEMIGKLKGKLSLIIVTHRTATTKYADEVIVLKNGFVNYRGPSDKFLIDSLGRI